MNRMSQQQHDREVVPEPEDNAPEYAPWSRSRRLMLNIPIFVILIGLLVYISNATAVPWNNEPTGQTIATLNADTSVTFAAKGHGTAELAAAGRYRVVTTVESVDSTRPSTGETQHVTVVVRRPDTAQTGLPGVVFMHGAGQGTAFDSFGDIAEDMASAGFVTAVLDKPSWSTEVFNRDYEGSAAAYDQVVDLLRRMPQVADAKVGIYATSESTWISAYLLDRDPRIAFQVLLSPMVFPMRQALGFLAAQDFALVGANDGYQSIVRRAFNADVSAFDLPNVDIDTLRPATYDIPTFVGYGAKDVMTAQVEGAEAILDMAHRAGNWDVTIRGYPVANHVLRLAQDSQAGTQFADEYVRDVIAWVSGVTQGLEQTSERVAGSTLYQSIPVPKELRAKPALTWYGLVLHGAILVMLLAALVMASAALALRIRGRIVGRPFRLGFTYGFGRMLLTLTLTTIGVLLLFAAGIAQVVMAVVNLAWGGAPDDHPGLMQWSWPVIQGVCTLVVWAWSRLLARLIEVATGRGIMRLPPRTDSIRGVVSGREPVLATTRFARILFWVVATAMFLVLLMFAFWGLFIY